MRLSLRIIILLSLRRVRSTRNSAVVLAISLTIVCGNVTKYSLNLIIFYGHRGGGVDSGGTERGGL